MSKTASLLILTPASLQTAAKPNYNLISTSVCYRQCEWFLRSCYSASRYSLLYQFWFRRPFFDYDHFNYYFVLISWKWSKPSKNPSKGVKRNFSSPLFNIALMTSTLALCFKATRIAIVLAIASNKRKFLARAASCSTSSSITLTPSQHGF